MTDSAWGTVPADDVQRLIAQQAASAKRVAELEAEVERLTKRLDVARATITGLRRLIHEANRSDWKVDL